MRFLRQSLTGFFLAAVTLGLLVYAAQMIRTAVQDRFADDKPAPPARERVFAVNVQKVELKDETPVLEAFGEVQSRRTLELRTAVGGRVIALSDGFVEGGDVARGDVLLQIDPADAQSGLDRADNDVSDAQAEGRDAKRALELAGDELEAAEQQAALRETALRRQLDLQARGVGTAAAVETAELAASTARQAVLAERLAQANAQARVDQAVTRLARAQIAKAEAQRRLDDTTVKAEFSGTLSGVTVVQGRLVSANEKLAQLIDPDMLEVSFRVSTAQYARLLDDQGQLLHAPAEVTLDVAGVDLRATGQISRDSAATATGQTGRVIFARLEPAPGFKPGDFVTVAVEEPAVKGVARLPASALDAFGTVLVLGPEDRLKSVEVELVRRQGDDVLIRADDLQGQDVVTTRSPLLGAGIAVRPLRKDGAVTEQQPKMLQLSAERRARLVAFVQNNKRMPSEAKARILDELDRDQVPARMVERIESRMGG